MRLVMAPDRAGRHDNPYLAILCDALRAEGCAVGGLFGPAGDALHVHWLEFPLWGRVSARLPLWARLRMRRVIALARQMRAAGRPVVWTVHNLRPHEFPTALHREIHATMCREFLPLVSDVICMSATVRRLALEAFPELAGARVHLIRHPDYVRHFATMHPATPPELARLAPAGGPVLATFGMLRPYKGIPATVAAMKALGRPFRLVIAGKGPEAEIAAIARAIGDDRRFVLIARRLSDAEILGLTRAADLVLFNFTAILNSGSVLASLSMGRPVLAPGMGAIGDLARDLGPAWVRRFEGRLDAATIAAALEDLPVPGVPDLGAYAPQAVARAHLAVYRGEHG